MLFRFADRSWTFPGIRVMGILNVTPDSFYDGGRFLDPAAALDRAQAMARDGADMIDVGGESTRPMAAPVSTQEELDRVIPPIRAICRALPIPVSIDTTKSEVARLAVAEGASVINDVSGGRADPALARVAASTGAGLILMHSRGDSRTMQTLTQYESVAADVATELADALKRAEAAGVDPEQIVVDPGFGFAKTAGQNLVLLRELEALRGMGRPVLAGVSRKSFLGALIDQPPERRLAASLSAQFLAMLRGCDIIRTHDVRETVETVKILNAILAARPSAVR